MGDHGIVDRIRVFGDVEIFLHDTPRVGEERPVGANSASVFIRLVILSVLMVTSRQ